MLNKTISDKILEFVRQKPRTVQEIAFLLEKNWRTANRYVEQITLESGQINVRTFREGSRGALKVVYWNALEPGKGSAYQERLLTKILNGTKKEDFSPFDIYQFVPEDKRHADLKVNEFHSQLLQRYLELIRETQHQVLFFSGNLSWMDGAPEVYKAFEGLLNKKIPLKILTRVDITSKNNTEKLLQLNHRLGWDGVSIRHCEQPLRITIIDDRVAHMKEVLSPYIIREVKEKTILLYEIHDYEWVIWLQKVFWHLWGQSVDAETRLKALKTLHQN